MIQENDFRYQPLPAGPAAAAPTPRLRRARLDDEVSIDTMISDGDADDGRWRAAKRRCIDVPAQPVRCVPVPRLLASATGAAAVGTQGPVDAPGAAAGGAGDPPPPRTVAASLAACGRLLLEPEYRTGLAMILACGVGNGLLDSAYLMVMDQLGSEQHSLPILAMKMVSAMQAASSVSSMIVAHHQRDLEDLTDAPLADVPQCYMRGLAWCGVVDMANALAMAGCVVGFERGWMRWPALVGALTVAKTIDSYKDTRDYGFWSCLKVHLGDAAARQEQRRLNRTLIGVEMGMLSAIYYSQSLGVYALALRYADSNLLGVGAAVLMGGGLLASLPKLYFLCRSRRPSRQDASDAV